MSRYALEWAKQQLTGSAEAKTLLLVLADYAEGADSTCTINEARLCDDTGIGWPDLPVVIKVLEGDGLVATTLIPRPEPKNYASMRLRAYVTRTWGENVQFTLLVPRDWRACRTQRPEYIKFEYTQPTAVYRFYDSAGSLLYVGITVRTDVRFEQHRQRKDWWPQVATREITWYPDRYAAEAEEFRAITQERPLHNVRHGRKRSPA